MKNKKKYKITTIRYDSFASSPPRVVSRHATETGAGRALCDNRRRGIPIILKKYEGEEVGDDMTEYVKATRPK